jgi:hypothetical protein
MPWLVLLLDPEDGAQHNPVAYVLALLLAFMLVAVLTFRDRP